MKGSEYVITRDGPDIVFCNVHPNVSVWKHNELVWHVFDGNAQGYVYK